MSSIGASDDQGDSAAPAAEVPGQRVLLRLVEKSHRTRLREILAAPEVARWWGPPESEEWPCDGDGKGEARYAVLIDGAAIGLIQYGEELDPMYRHAGIDIFIDPAAHGRGYGRDALRSLCRHLLEDRGHHRLTIDPAASNERAIGMYASIGFARVGLMRAYERNADGLGWHDGLLMDLLVGELR